MNYYYEKKSLIIMLLGVTLLNSCTDSEKFTQLSIKQQCNSEKNICSSLLLEETILKTTNILGKTKIKIIETQPVTVGEDFTWVINGTAELATSFNLTSNELPSCSSTLCVDSENPSGFTFNKGSNSVGARGIVTSGGKEVNLNSIPVAKVYTTEDGIPKHPTQVTYKMPTGSTMSATAAAAAFVSSGLTSELSAVIGDDTNSTLTFVCKSGEYIDPAAIGLAEGQSQLRGSWNIINTKVPTPYFNGSSWQDVQFIAALNNVSGDSVTGTGADCGVPF